MTEPEPLGMEEMQQIFDVVDDLEISREKLQVELMPSAEGSITRLANGRLGIVLPETGVSNWLPTLRRGLAELRTADDLE